MQEKLWKDIKLITNFRLIFCICILSIRYKNQETETGDKYLKKIYDEKFVSKHIHFVEMDQEWKSRTVPKENSDWGFTIRTDGLFGEENFSRYAKFKFTMESRKYNQQILKKILGRKIYFNSNVITRSEVNYKNLPIFEDVLKTKSEKINFCMM